MLLSVFWLDCDTPVTTGVQQTLSVGLWIAISVRSCVLDKTGQSEDTWSCEAQPSPRTVNVSLEGARNTWLTALAFTSLDTIITYIPH